LAALQMLRICLSGRPKRRKQPERYAKLPSEFFGKYFEKILDKQ
jgi:hypothetical protein